MRQPTLASQGFVKYPMKTRKAQFLEDMDQIIPWSALVELIEPYYPKPQGAGRCPIGIERMVRIYFCSIGMVFLTRRWKKRCMT